MRVLLVIHGYPPRYNAGSEIYTQTIAHGLHRAGHDVRVFAREDDPFRPDYELRLERDRTVREIGLSVVNMPRCGETYRHERVDEVFGNLVDEFRPEIVHIGHLHHLSTSLVEVAHRRGIPMVFTLHDFWLMCPRGQFLQTNPGGTAWALCEGQEDRKCATHCYCQYRSGERTRRRVDRDYWTAWVHHRMTHVRRMAGMIDLFIAPSRTLLNRFRDDFGIPEKRLVYLDYGFDHGRLRGRKRVRERSFVFGYIGTHIPAKGIPVLLDAFARLEGDVRLRLWGRPNGAITPSLRNLASNPLSHHAPRVEWMGEYDSRNIVKDVFNKVDAIVVPSIWPENSPLVIHEAQQARVPVIASDMGGIAEYVRDGGNGLLFRARDSLDLAAQMQRFALDHTLARRLGDVGYLWSASHDVPAIGSHVRDLVSLYETAIGSRGHRSEVYQQ